MIISIDNFILERFAIAGDIQKLAQFKSKGAFEEEETFTKMKQQCEDMRFSILTFIQSLNSLKRELNFFSVVSESYEEKLHYASSNINSVFLTSEQEKIFRTICVELSAIVPLNDYIIMGFIKRTMKQWQIQQSRPIMDLQRIHIVERIKIVARIMENACSHMVRGFYHPNKEFKENLSRIAYVRAMDCYDEMLMLGKIATDLKPGNFDSNIEVVDVNHSDPLIGEFLQFKSYSK